MLVEKYKTMTPELRERARHLAEVLSTRPGVESHVNQFNAELLVAFRRAEQEIARVQSPADMQPVTFMQVLNGFRPLLYVLVILGGIAALIFAVVAAIKGLVTSVTAFFVEYGGYIAGVVFGAVLLSCLPNPFRRDPESTVTEETYEEETLYHRKSYSKKTSA